MKKLSSVVLTVTLLVCGLYGQRDQTLFGSSGLKLTGAWGGPIIGTGFYDQDAAFMQGGFGGLEFNKIVLLGFGGERTSGAVTIGRNGESSFELDHGGLLIGVSPQQHKVVHPNFRFMIGGGEVRLNDKREDNVFVVQPGVGLEVNVFQWWKVGLEGGYRFVTNVDLGGMENDDFSALYMNLRLRFGWSWGQ